MSLYMLSVLTSKFPLQFELRICLLSMYCTYGTALTCIVPSNVYLYVQLTTTILSSSMSHLARSKIQLNSTGHSLSAENPLNNAAAMGHVDFVKEILRLKPVFARVLKSDEIVRINEFCMEDKKI
ncbi:hypothetical protein SADUNF_Sadunf12G0088000 [Salix dunnii]|uniref:Ankyrin repeat family protein n=1 Tax=Salix dunnii TaxID=1413687 RepID=A0A835JLB6_9ROSI|nr:hypothetical protein SADUNF_Sadunf12G0088000 [Salix dunnii]